MSSNYKVTSEDTRLGVSGLLTQTIPSIKSIPNSSVSFPESFVSSDRRERERQRFTFAFAARIDAFGLFRLIIASYFHRDRVTISAPLMLVQIRLLLSAEQAGND